MTIGSIADWAERWKISRVAAYKRINKHGIPWVSPGKIDLDEADRIWKASRDPAKEPGAIAGGEAVAGGRQAAELDDDEEPAASNEYGGLPNSKLGQARLHMALLKIRRERLTIDQMEGKLVPLAAVREFEAKIFTMVKGELLLIGAALREDLAASDDPIECQRLVDNRVNAALRRFATFRPDADPAAEPVDDEEQAVITKP